MSRVGKAYKKTVELRKGLESEIDDDLLVTVTDQSSTEDFNLTRAQFLSGTGINPVNPTSGFIPINENAQFVDSPIRYDSGQNLLISTATLQVPAGTYFLGQSVNLSNNAGIISENDLVQQETSFFVNRPENDNGTFDFPFAGLPRLNKVIWKIVQPLEDEDILFGPGETIEELDVVFTNTADGTLRGSRAKGSFGKFYINIWVARDPNDDNTLTNQQLIDLPAEDKIEILNGLIDQPRAFDLDNPTNPPDTDELFYNTPVFNAENRKLIIKYFSADGNPVQFKGTTISGQKIPRIESNGQDRFRDNVNVNGNRNVTDVTSPTYDVVFTDQILFADTSSNSITITLESANAFLDNVSDTRTLIVKRVGSNPLTVAAQPGETINGQANVNVQRDQFVYITAIPGGTGYRILFASDIDTFFVVNTTPFSATTESILLVDTTADDITVNLPAGASYLQSTGPLINIKNYQGNNNVTIVPNGSETIEDDTSALLFPGTSLTLTTDSTNWWVV